MFAAKDLVVSSTSLPTDCEEDYLQDQDLWKDSLPQPYQLIDELLQDVLFASWQLIEARRSDREAEKSKPIIPNHGEAKVLTSIKDVTDVTPCSCLHENCFVMFVTCSAGLLLINMKTCVNGEGEPAIMAQESLNGTIAERVHSKCWRDMKYHSLLTVTMATGKLRLYAFYNGQFIMLLAFSSNELEVNGRVVSSLISKQCSHLVVAIDGEDSCYANVYSLPEESWQTELDKLQPDNGKSLTFSKPSLLLHVKCPPTFQPCPYNNPATALASITSRGAETILSSEYYENRRRAFVSQRRDFVNPQPPEKSNKRLPHFHLLYYDHGVKKVTPSQLVLWWEGDINLLFYSIEAKTTGDTAPLYRWPHSSPICRSVVNNDSSLLAVGLMSGGVVLWNLVSYQHVGVVGRCGTICSLLFIKSRLMTTSRPKSTISMAASCSHALLIGCSNGSLYVTDCSTPSSITLANRVSVVDDALTKLLVTPALPELVRYTCVYIYSGLIVTAMSLQVACLQESGTLLLRNALSGESICSFTLPTSFLAQTLCFTSSGNLVMFVDRESFLRMVHLENVQPLHGCWEEGHEWEGLKTQQNSGQIELITQFLQDYLTNRKNATPERLLRSQQRWKELSTEVAVISRLKTQTRQSQLVRDAFKRQNQVTT
ncbi:WD repeat-containing protein 93-like isoform X2 [Dysidea avara]|uniref:WD repeat-containing protein 93-like isoform X2 n=1 Tax=Dysidea avara TaxID=196820 RepID=UPI0033179607